MSLVKQPVLWNCLTVALKFKHSYSLSSNYKHLRTHIHIVPNKTPLFTFVGRAPPQQISSHGNTNFPAASIERAKRSEESHVACITLFFFFTKSLRQMIAGSPEGH